jgi:IS5 family transposase
MGTMLRLHLMQRWFTLSDPAMEEALHDVPLFRQFAGLDYSNTRLPDESTIQRFRLLPEQHELASQTPGRGQRPVAPQGAVVEGR